LFAKWTSQKQNYASLEETFLDKGGLTSFIREKNTDVGALGDEAEEQMIAAQEQYSPRIFCNLNSPVCNRISSLSNSGSYHDHVSFDPSRWLLAHDCCSTKMYEK